MTRAVTPHREWPLSGDARWRPAVGHILGTPCGRPARGSRPAAQAGARRRRYGHSILCAISRREVR